MKIVAFFAIALISSTLGVEERVPKHIYAHKSFCVGENMRLSCAGDGTPFVDYKMSVVGVDVYAAESVSQECSAKSTFSQDSSLCSIDLSSAPSEYTGLVVEIESICSGQRECFIELPSSKELFSSIACDKYTTFHAVSVEFICTEPGAVETAVSSDDDEESEDEAIDWTQEVDKTEKSDATPAQVDGQKNEGKLEFGLFSNGAASLSKMITPSLLLAVAVYVM